ncbi:adenosylcobinamide-phosphate synthase CbiB [Marinimicrobium sp. ABcell2]|uniref:adenosylcobinamide-phosphate synthase CbiB n=1 Tax=Marinimicrobium sp. ABcell2 TaxID=3069751 RepID=UPI0027B3E560|nr:adenosylcobinamide-phosphate synthase CbiB [Marinimicrobium sp. ABcell2]MDQ2076737.1 adenosylcobinamide-phosphate synthase CbiB [Marinimicrobium sp. ABcell2]
MSYGLTLAALLAACLLDRCLGESRRWHPLVGFGQLAQWVESTLNRDASCPVGFFATLLLLVPPTALAFWLQQTLPKADVWGLAVYWLLSCIGLYLALGWRSLTLHVRAVSDALAEKDLPLARAKVGLIVSRDCRAASELEVRRAAMESALENTSDAIVAPLFWFLVAGLPGVILYRLSNTLDAMWGYKNTRFKTFGWAAARWDDLLNWVPARLTALGFVLCGNARSGWRAWRKQAGLCESPNAGPVMCAGAGALGVRLGGPAVYGGEVKQKPWMGDGADPVDEDVERAFKLIAKCVGFWLFLAVLGLLLVR